MRLFTTAAGDYDVVLLYNSSLAVPKAGAAAEGDTIVNEDGSGDAILFENGDNWVTE